MEVTNSEDGEIVQQEIDPEKLWKMCKAHESKYRCPNCGILTWCVQWVRQHKKELKWDGLPKASKFVPINSYNENNLAKDINFIEGGLTIVNQSRRTTSETNDVMKIDKKWKFLRYFWRKWRNIALKLAPSVFKRHQINQSFYNQSEKIIYWTLELKIEKSRADKKVNFETIILHKTMNENFSLLSIVEELSKGRTIYEFTV